MADAVEKVIYEEKRVKYESLALLEALFVDLKITPTLKIIFQASVVCTNGMCVYIHTIT